MAKYSAGSAATGALSGAATGSVFGPVGTGVGAVVGGLAGLFGSKKKKNKPKKRSSLDPQQQALYNDYISSLRGQGPMSDLYNYDAQGANANFEQNVARPAYRGFEENIVPQITGQFRGNNLQNSSYAGQSLARAGRDVQENLDAQRSNMIFQGQQNAQSNKQNALQNILGMQTFAYEKPGAKAPNTIDQILGTTAPAAGEWFADFLKSKPFSGTSAPTTTNLSRKYPGQP